MLEKSIQFAFIPRNSPCIKPQQRMAYGIRIILLIIIFRFFHNREIFIEGQILVQYSRYSEVIDENPATVHAHVLKIHRRFIG